MNHADMYHEYEFGAEFYDHVVPYRNRQDIDFYIDMAKASAGPVLELGCGTGRVLIPVARAGVEITGMDAAPRMLDICRKKVCGEPAEVRERIVVLRGDMLSFNYARDFNLITVPFRAFQHLITAEEQLECLRSVHAALKPGGTFILDLFNPDLSRLVDDRYLTEGEAEPEFTMPDGRKVVRTSRAVKRDTFTQVQDIELIYNVTHPDGRTERLVDAFPMRYLFRYEAEHLLARTGLEVVDVYSDYDKSPYGSAYPGEMIFVARKSV